MPHTTTSIKATPMTTPTTDTFSSPPLPLLCSTLSQFSPFLNSTPYLCVCVCVGGVVCVCVGGGGVWCVGKSDLLGKKMKEDIVR